MANSIVIMGFDAFGEEISNPAARIASLFNGRIIDKYIVHGVIVPASYNSVRRSVRLVFELYNPGIILALGLSSSRPLPSIERIALNYADSSLPDTDGIVKVNEPVLENGDLALETDVDVYGLRDYLLEHGIPIIVSYHAGTYLCNYLYYLLLHKAREKNSKALFIHIPRGRNDVLNMIKKRKRFSHFVDEGLVETLVELTLRYLIGYR